VAVGMTVRHVQARCPNARVLPPDPDQDATAFEPFLAILDQFSPVVAMTEPGLAHGDITHLEAISGSSETLANAVSSAIQDATGADVRIGIAGNRFCAEMAAKAPCTPTEPPDDREHRGHARVILPGGERAFLHPLPIDLLPGLTPDTCARLRFLGVQTMGDLTRLSRHAVITRYGKMAGAAHELASGVDRSPLQARTQAMELSEREEFDEPIMRMDHLVFLVRRLLSRVETRLQADLLLCRACDVVLEMERDEPWCFRVNLAQPTASATQLTDLVRWQLERRKIQRRAGMNRVSFGIVALEIRVMEAVPQGDLQLSLFRSRAQSQHVVRALERLRALLGSEAVRRASVLADAALWSRRPERAFAFDDYRLPDQRTETIVPPVPLAPVPVLRFLGLPRPIHVSMRDGKLINLHAFQRRELVIACAGPWRLAQEWWDATCALHVGGVAAVLPGGEASARIPGVSQGVDGAAVTARVDGAAVLPAPHPAERAGAVATVVPVTEPVVMRARTEGGIERDYYQVLTEHQTAYLIFYDHRDDHWYLQGLFD